MFLLDTSEFYFIKSVLIAHFLLKNVFWNNFLNDFETILAVS